MKKWFLTLLLFSPQFLYAADISVPIQKTTAPVYASPTTSSDVLVTLKKGTKVKVSGVTEDGQWTKVSIVVSGFKFDGWLQRDAITKPKTVAPAPIAKAVKPAPKALPTKPATTNTLSKSSTTELEKFFEPSGTPSTSTAAPVEEVEEESEPVAQATPKPVKPKKVKKIREPQQEESSEGGESWRAGKLDVYGTPGYSFLQYTFSDDTVEAFRYTLGGPSVEVGADYHAFSWMDDLIRAAAQLNIQYILYQTKTNLLDGSSVQFGDVTAANALLDIWFKLRFMFNFEKIVGKPFLLGLSGGYQYTKFFGDDIVDDNGVPVGLFVGQTITSVPIGIISELHFLDPVVLTMAADVLIMNSVSESPSTSGSDPTASLGFSPYLHLVFPIAGENHFMGFKYRLRAQSTDFTGPSNSRVNSTLTNASALQIQHTVGLEYSYHF